VVAQRGDETGKSPHCPLPRSWHAVGVVQIDDRAGLHPVREPAYLSVRGHWTLPLGLHGPEHAGRTQTTDHRENRQIVHPPRRAEEARRGAADAGDGFMTAHDFALGLARAAEPEAPMAPRVIADVVPFVHDSPDQIRRRRGTAADQEERRRDTLTRED